MQFNRRTYVAWFAVCYVVLLGAVSTPYLGLRSFGWASEEQGLADHIEPIFRVLAFPFPLFAWEHDLGFFGIGMAAAVLLNIVLWAPVTLYAMLGLGRLMQSWRPRAK
jgi:hypothetical protein